MSQEDERGFLPSSLCARLRQRGGGALPIYPKREKCFLPGPTNIDIEILWRKKRSKGAAKVGILTPSSPKLLLFTLVCTGCNVLRPIPKLDDLKVQAPGPKPFWRLPPPFRCCILTHTHTHTHKKLDKKGWASFTSPLGLVRQIRKSRTPLDLLAHSDTSTRGDAL